MGPRVACTSPPAAGRPRTRVTTDLRHGCACRLSHFRRVALDLPMPASPSPATKPPVVSLPGAFLIAVFLLSLTAAGLSTNDFVKRLDQPPAGTYRVNAGETAELFCKLTHKSIKGMHCAEGVRGELAVPGEAAPRPLLVRDRNSSDWERIIKIPQAPPMGRSREIESNVVVLLEVTIPADPKLEGRTIPASFSLDMVLPRLDPDNPKAGRAVPDRAVWTVQLTIMPPGSTRIFQRVGHISLLVAGTSLVLLLVLIYVRGQRAAA